MTKKRSFWIIISLVTLVLLCVLSVGFGLLVYGLTSGQTPTLGGGDAVALIRIEGTIQGGDAPTDFFGEAVTGAYSNRIVAQLKAANNAEAIKAVVMRVDSPGGGVVASDEIYQQVAAMDKPIIVSMGTMAASGGYYISAPTDEIWANRHTLTGSLGVIVQFISAEDFLEEHGIEATSITSGDFKDTGSLFKDISAEGEAIWQGIVNDSYEVFVDIVAEGRNMDEETVRDLADGRVYTGQQALELNLVDNLGNLPEVIERAAELGGIEGDPRVIEYGRQSPLLGSFFSSLSRPSPVQELQTLLQLNTGPQLMYLYTGN